MKPVPRISIVMPAFCAASTIEESIASVQAQTFKAWELIIIDDGSTDDTLCIAKRLASEDARLRIIRQANAGPSAARNRGIKLAQSEFIAFLDADDLWSPVRLDGMFNRIVPHTPTGVLFSRTRFIDSSGSTHGTLSPHFNSLTAADLLSENVLCSSSNIFCRKEIFEHVGYFSERLHFAEDQDWLVRVALDGRWTIDGIDQEWFFYRSSNDSQSADLEAMKDGWQCLIRTVKEAYPVRGAQAADLAFAPFHRQLARRALRMAQPKTAFYYLSLALKRDPCLLLRQPRRTGLTLAGAFLSSLPIPYFKELVAR